MGMRRLAFFLCLAILGLASARAAAGDRYALVITGATGEDKYVQQYDDWRARLVTVLADRFGFGRDHVIALGDKANGSTRVASRENVRTAIDGLAARMHSHDLLVVVLIGHGSLDGTIAKFNLVGPDLDAGQWAAVLKDVPGKLIVADTTGAGLVYSDYCEISAGRRQEHPVNDYQRGSIREDFDFGAELLYHFLHQARRGGGGSAPRGMRRSVAWWIGAR